MDQVSCHKKCFICQLRFGSDFKCEFVHEGKYLCGVRCLEDLLQPYWLKEDEFWEVKKIKIKTCMGCEKDL